MHIWSWFTKIEDRPFMLRSLTEIKAVAVVAKKSVDHPTDGGSLAPLSQASPSKRRRSIEYGHYRSCLSL